MADNKAKNTKDVNKLDEQNEAFAEELKALKESLLEEARAESKRIVEEAREEAKLEAAKIAKEAAEGDKPYQESEEEKAAANKLVKVKLFKDKDKYKDDVLVIVNGQSYLIKRGVTVEIPQKVYDVLKCSDEQTGVAADIIGGYEERYESSKSVLE